MIIKEYFSVKNTCYKNNVNKVDSRYSKFQKNGPQGLMLHSVGCPQPSAEVFAKAWNAPRPFGIQVSVHAVLQADGLVYQCLPWNFRGWHSSSGKNGAAHDTHIGVEMTEPDCIKYTSGSNFTCSNLEKAQEQAKGTYKTAVELFAYLCKEYSLDPLKDGVIISHKEGYKRGIASNHGDPEHLWTQLKLPYTMDTFRKDVKKAMQTVNTEEVVDEAIKVYKVQTGAYKTAKNAQTQLEKVKAAGFDAIVVKENDIHKVQVGAYTVKANADNMANKLKKASFDTYIVVKEKEEVIELKAGDKVKVNKGAKIYGTNTTFQNWVYLTTLYIRSIDGDRVVISTQKTGAITGAVNKADLIKL